MDRLIAPNSVPLVHADTAPTIGTPQYATGGNPALSIPPTSWPAYQYNAIQEELMAVIDAAGLTPDRADNAQVLAAINALYGSKFHAITIQVKSSTGTYTPTAGMVFVLAILTGAGGGSGGTDGSQGAGCGGAGGTVFKIYSAADIGVSKSIVIGAGGSAGASGSNHGENGGNTLFLGVTAGGGGRGFAGGPSGPGSGGVGGAGSGLGDLNLQGGDGSDGGNATLGGSTGIGGSSFWGGGGRSGRGGPGANGRAPGAGAGAPYDSIPTPGGSGANGIAVFVEFLAV